MLTAFAFAGLGLVLTFTPLGYGVGGNKNWLDLGGPGNMLRFQPAEIAKLAIVVWGAAVLANKQKLLHEAKHLLFPFLPFSLLLVGLVVLQRDLGTAMIMGALVIAVLWCVGAPWQRLAALIGAVGGGAVALVALNANRLQRILGFLDPTTDPTGVNHQPLQALYGLATGGWVGVVAAGSVALIWSTPRRRAARSPRGPGAPPCDTPPTTPHRYPACRR